MIPLNLSLSHRILERVPPNILVDGVLDFPDPLATLTDGIVATSKTITPASLLYAYENGIFPWPYSDSPRAAIPWACPQTRGVIKIQEFNIPPRELRTFRSRCLAPSSTYFITQNTAFEQVTELCGAVHALRQGDTWVTKKLQRAYNTLHQLGFAYSLEVLNTSRQLVGGLFGVCCAGIVSAESMFYLEPNTGKFALIHLLQHLQRHELKLLDVQMVTPSTGRYGAIEIHREEYLAYLASVSDLPLDFSGLNPA